TGQREARNLLAAREWAKPALLLLIGAVVQQQLARAERVRHHHRDRGGDRAAGDARDHARMRERGKAEATIFLWQDHAEEALLFDVIPNRCGQITLLINLPVADAPAEFLGRAVEERLFLCAQRSRLEIEQLLPVRHAAEQVAVPPDRAGLERDAFGVA